MKTIRIAAALSVLCLPLAALPVPAVAATAHNSQAGAMGSTSNSDKPTGMAMRKKQMMTRKKRM